MIQNKNPLRKKYRFEKVLKKIITKKLYCLDHMINLHFTDQKSETLNSFKFKIKR